MFQIFLLSCAPEIAMDEPLQLEDVAHPLDEARLTRRLSLDIRGILPSKEEIDIAQQNDISTTIDAFIQSEEHSKQLLSLFNFWFKTRVDTFNLTERDYHLPQDQAFPLIQSVGEEPLRLLAYVASHDMPWQESVRTDLTMANELLVDIWPIERETFEEEWHTARYTDGRPSGGVLMTNGLWWRYYTTPNNFSRSRAMILSELFLCENYLHKPIKFQAPALLERESLNEFIRTDPACIGCHSTLDPIAAALFGFWWYDLYDTAEMSFYHTDREPLGEFYLEQEAAWFGKPIQAPVELGIYLSQDTRFTQCTVQKSMEFLLHRTLELSDFNARQFHHEAFAHTDWRFSGLLKSIFLSNEYQAGEPLDETNVSLSTRRLLSVDQLQQVLQQISGLSWKKEGFDQFQNDLYGYRTLLGGFDGQQTKQRSNNPSLTQQLSIKRLAQATSQHLIEQHWNGDSVPLFANFTLVETSENDPEFSEIITQIHWMLFSTPPTQERIELDKEYFALVKEEHNIKQAWLALVSVALRDPNFWTY